MSSAPRPSLRRPGRSARFRWSHAAPVLLVLVMELAAWPVQGFSFLEPADAPADAARWSFAPGSPIVRGLRVAVADDLPGRLGLDAADFLRRVEASIAVWEQEMPGFAFDVEYVPAILIPVVDHDVTIEHSDDVEGFIVAYAGTSESRDPGRILSNGYRSPGRTIHRGSIEILSPRMLLLGSIAAGTNLPFGDFVQQTLIHEVGHVLGLGHPNEVAQLGFNYDDDGDPLTIVELDLSDPFAALRSSPNWDTTSIMFGGVGSGLDYALSLFRKDLSADDISGIRVLYPPAGDRDADGIIDAEDNCVDVANPVQADLDAGADDDSSLPGLQAYGDACDADLDDDGWVGASDFFEVLRPCMGRSAATAPECESADLDGDGQVDARDYTDVLAPALATPPGPGVTVPWTLQQALDHHRALWESQAPADYRFVRGRVRVFRKRRITVSNGQVVAAEEGTLSGPWFARDVEPSDRTIDGIFDELQLAIDLGTLRETDYDPTLGIPLHFRSTSTEEGLYQFEPTAP